MKTPQLPIPKLTTMLGVTSEVWLKREDQHHYGSHKGRSIPLMISEHHQEGRNNFVISSSGNAALAAARAVKAHNKNKPSDLIRLQIFLGPSITPQKHESIIAETTDMIVAAQVPNPKKTAQQFATTEKATLLRQSTEPRALLGYHELAQELSKIENLAAVFVPTSSGTTALGLAQGFAKLNLHPQIHIVQTTACHPIVEYIMTQAPDKQGGRNVAPLLAMTQKSLADAIVDKIAYRKSSVAEVIKNSHGNGWIATNNEITEAIKLIKTTADITISPNSALSVAGLAKAIKNGWQWTAPVVCLITGA